MEVYIIDEFDITDDEKFIYSSEPYVSAEKAMKDIMYSSLDWEYITTTKMDGTVLERWEAIQDVNGDRYLYRLEATYVIGSDD